MILQEHGIIIAPQLSWEGITFHDNMGDDEYAWFLAECGITLNEADNCHNFAFTWIQENNTPEEKETQLHILFSQAVTMADTHPTVEPWQEPVLHRFDETHVGANRPATLAGGKQQDCHCYGHRSRYRVVHHTIVG